MGNASQQDSLSSGDDTGAASCTDGPRAELAIQLGAGARARHATAKQLHSPARLVRHRPTSLDRPVARGIRQGGKRSSDTASHGGGEGGVAEGGVARDRGSRLPFGAGSVEANAAPD